MAIGTIAEVVIGESLLSHLDQLFACGFGENEEKRRKEK
jgi:hypothetical protein